MSDFCGNPHQLPPYPPRQLSSSISFYRMRQWRKHPENVCGKLPDQPHVQWIWSSSDVLDWFRSEDWFGGCSCRVQNTRISSKMDWTSHVREGKKTLYYGWSGQKGPRSITKKDVVITSTNHHNLIHLLRRTSPLIASWDHQEIDA